MHVISSFSIAAALERRTVRRAEHAMRRACAAIDICGQSSHPPQRSRFMRPSTPRQPPAPTPADVRLGPLLAVPALLREAGIDPAPLLAACGLAELTFDDAENRVPFAAAARMLQDAACATGREDFGLIVGQRAGADSLGVLSLLMQRAATVGDALQGLARHISLQDRGAVVYVATNRPGMMALGYAVHDDATPGLGIIYDLAMTLALAVLRGLCGPQWCALEVRLPHSHPKRPASGAATSVRQSCSTPPARKSGSMRAGSSSHRRWPTQRSNWPCCAKRNAARRAKRRVGPSAHSTSR
jgi:hypothetical protein